MNRLRFSLVLFFVMLFGILSYGQSAYKIGLLNDDDIGFAPQYEQQVKNEINNLLGSRTEIEFESYVIKESYRETEEMLNEIYGAHQVDLVIGVGIISSLYLANREVYEIPTISGVVIDRELLGLPRTELDGSGVENYTYIQTPFNVERDLELFYELFPYKKLGILIDTDIGKLGEFFNSYWRKRIPDSISFELIESYGTLDEKLDHVIGKYDALYLLSFPYESEDKIRDFYHKLNHEGIPTFSLTGRAQVEYGALAGLAPSNYITSIIRRLAIDVMNIYEGQDISILPTTIDNTGEDFVVNYSTLKHLNLYPDFDLLNQAILLDLEKREGEQIWSIESLIYESLKTNLSLHIAQQDVSVADEDIKIAKSNLRPQLSASTTANLIDPARVDNSFGQAADVSWLANATLSQVIYNEPARANIAIQKILKESQSESLRQTELDLILETSRAYLSYLQAQSVVRIQNENVEVTNQNLNISESKEALGYSGISDVYRLRTQLSQNVIDLNTAISSLNQARININRLINRDQKEEFSVTDISVSQSTFSLGANPELERVINNQRDLDKLTDFFVKKAFENLPELKMLGYALKAQERSLLSNKRSLYQPQVNLQATLDQPIGYYGAATPPQGFGGLTKDLQWGILAQVKLPLFQGGLRNANIERDMISIDQIRNQELELRNNLEAQLRSNMQILSASYQELQLSQTASEYSEKNFDIIQDLYRQGQVDIITLVDAQNASLRAQLNATNVLYQLVVDFLTVERSTGSFFFLMSDNEKTLFTQEFMNMILSK